MEITIFKLWRISEHYGDHNQFSTALFVYTRCPRIHYHQSERTDEFQKFWLNLVQGFEETPKNIIFPSYIIIEVRSATLLVTYFTSILRLNLNINWFYVNLHAEHGNKTSTLFWSHLSFHNNRSTVNSLQSSQMPCLLKLSFFCWSLLFVLVIHFNEHNGNLNYCECTIMENCNCFESPQYDVEFFHQCVKNCNSSVNDNRNTTINDTLLVLMSYIAKLNV